MSVEGDKGVFLKRRQWIASPRKNCANNARNFSISFKKSDCVEREIVVNSERSSGSQIDKAAEIPKSFKQIIEQFERFN